MSSDIRPDRVLNGSGVRPPQPQGTFSAHARMLMASTAGLCFGLLAATAVHADGHTEADSDSVPSEQVTAEQAASADTLAELKRARAELAEAARKLARIERSLVTGRGPEVEVLRETTEDGEEMKFVVKRIHAAPHPARPGHPPHPARPQRAPKAPRLGIMIGGEPGANEVLGLAPGGGAASAGIEPGDRIVAINGTALSADTSIADLLADVEAGEVVNVDFQRGDETRRTEVTTSMGAGQPHVFELAYKTSEDGTLALELEGLEEELGNLSQRIVIATEGDRLGRRNFPMPGLFALGPQAELASNHAGLERYFGTADGVLVLRIAEDNSLRLQSGDVILSVDDEPVSQPHDVARQLLGRSTEDSIALEILRDGESITVAGKVPSAPVKDDARR